ncbi:hypothetical protein JX266_000466 [Neoarthrinium moseri]|uniref:uncharacterized protein n=1 Tax=Neoarthrinium moseri TaxID=1658444 RepID=UPI001FDC65E0|nr:uncharacterized protein JN550_004223 [Neoarthrinium moseri]KAI1855601.1 hypothetical protein JX266_000466 [Neoarthrinium moseri]KAI1872020.1 hypothetical protein JN550_004223 [Neoarthrinium moseri]
MGSSNNSPFPPHAILASSARPVEALQLEILQENILHQLKILVEFQGQIATAREPIASEWIYTGILEILGLALAALFGAFTVLAWQNAKIANELATKANDIASDAEELAKQANNMTLKGNCLNGAATFMNILQYCQSSEDHPVESCVQLTHQFKETEASEDRFFAAMAAAILKDISGCYPNDHYTPGPATTNTPSATSRSASTSLYPISQESLNLTTLITITSVVTTTLTSSRTSTVAVVAPSYQPSTSSLGTGAVSSNTSSLNSEAQIRGAGPVVGGVIGAVTLVMMLCLFRYYVYKSRKRQSVVAKKISTATFDSSSQSFPDHGKLP